MVPVDSPAGEIVTKKEFYYVHPDLNGTTKCYTHLVLCTLETITSWTPGLLNLQRIVTVFKRSYDQPQMHKVSNLVCHLKGSLAKH